MNDISSLKEAASYVEDRILSSTLTVDSYISTENLLPNKAGAKSALSLPPNGSKLPAYKCDDILISNIRPYLKKIWFSNKDGGCSADVLVLRAKNGVDPKFLYYSLFRDDFFAHAMRGAKGTKMPRGDKSQILEFAIPKFSLERQRSIASVLSSIDAKIDCNIRINAELESIANMLYDYWFVQFNFPDANGKPYKTSGGEMVYNPSLKINIPADWNDGTLNDLGRIVGGSTPNTSIPNNFTSAGTPWITPYDLSANQGKKFITRGGQDVSDEGIKDASLKILPAGTVLLSSRAPIGYMAIARNEVTTNQGFKSFIPNDGFSTAYIYYTVNRSLKAIIQYSSGSTFKEVSGGVLKTVKIVLPASTVINSFTNSVSSIFRKQNELELENQQLSELRDWLLPMLMNGQVTVSQ